MAAVKQKRIICILLTAMMLLTGMCFGTSRTDSFLAYAASGQETYPILRLSAGAAAGEELCTEELLGGRSLCSIARQVADADPETDSMAAALPSSLGDILQNPTFTFQGSGHEESCENRSASVIIGYIHRQDGSKS